MTPRNRYALSLLAVLAAAALCGAAAPDTQEAPQADPEADSMPNAVRGAALAIGAAIIMAGAAMGTAKVQAAVGAGGTGALAEKPELFITIVILMAIPETIIVLGFVMAMLLWSSI